MKMLVRILLLLSFLFAGVNCRAAIPGQMNEDIDIFLLNASIPAERPNVLIIWDNTANWGQTMGASTAYDLEKQALSTVIANLTTGPNGEPLYNVGLMLFTETGGGNSNIRGAYPRYHIRPMTGKGYVDPITGVADAVGNKQRLADLISSLGTIADRGSNAQYAKAMHEAYLYLGGRPSLAGAGQMKRDCAAFADSISGGAGAKNLAGVCTLNSQTYASPIGDGCQKNYIIFISNGTTDNGENKEAQGLLAGLPPAPSGGVAAGDPIVLNPSGEQANWADEYSRYLAKNTIHPNPKFAEARAKTFTVAVYDSTNCVSPYTKNTNACNQRALAKSKAEKGEGEFFDGTDLAKIQAALEQTFARIKDVDGVFASTTLPVSVNVRGTHVNQLYMGVFRPDAGLAPRWVGNLKMYQLALNTATNTVFLADANGNVAENAQTGFITGSARSHWTMDSTYWAFHPDVIAGKLTSSDNPDGPLVERGAVAQGLRTAYAASQAGRNLYTCTGTCGAGSALSGTTFADSNTDITATLLGVQAEPDPVAARTDLINWLRGQDNKENEDNNGVATDVRASIHGDVLHSRPAVVNYNRNSPSDDNDVYAFYGTNDGIFRAVKGGVTGATNAGVEAWGFVAPEFFDRLKRLRDNTPVMSPTNRRQYFMDGPIGVYRKDNNNDGKIDITVDVNDKVHLFIGMRRGGRFIYALDVSNPSAPSLLWKKSNADAGFGELGYTWSEPKVATVNIGGTAKTVLIMGAGYDPTIQDNELAVPGTDTMGRGILVLDAADGSIIWQAGFSPSTTPSVTVAGMTNSIPSDVTILDRDGNGFIDRLYVGDTGGNLWRVDIADPDPANWAVNKLAAIGGAAAADRRKFLYPPDVVFNPGASPNFDSVLIGTGDREHPFEVTVANRYYMFKDAGTGSSFVGPTITEADLYNVDANLIQTGDATQQATATAALQASKGWVLSMATGEKVISGSITLGGATFFNTNQPTSVATTACTNNLGVARQYAVSFEDATALIDFDSNGLTTGDRSTVYGQGGYLPSPVPVVVQLPDADGNLRLFNVVVSGTKVSMPPQAKLESRYRTYWYLKTDCDPNVQVCPN